VKSERSEPGHLKNGGVDNVKFKIKNINNQYTKGLM